VALSSRIVERWLCRSDGFEHPRRTLTATADQADKDATSAAAVRRTVPQLYSSLRDGGLA